MNPQRFGELMGGLISATSHRMTPREIEVWRRLMEDISDAALEAALTRAACECEAFPSVALIRRLASEAEAGTVDTNADTFARVAEAVRRFGSCLPCVPKCDRCRADLARAYIGEIGWRAVQGIGGWGAVCDSPVDQRSNLRAHFRDAYRAVAERESRDRMLPAPLRPRVEHTTVRAIPEAPKGLPSPPPEQPTREQVEAASLRVFRDAEPDGGERAVDEESRRRQAAWLERKIRQAGEVKGDGGATEARTDGVDGGGGGVDRRPSAGPVG